MQIANSTYSIEQTTPAWRPGGRAALVTGLAAVVVLAAIWTPTSAEVTEGEQAAAGVVVAAPAGGQGIQAQEMARLADDYSEWLRGAHGRAAANSEEQPLPPQF